MELFSGNLVHGRVVQQHLPGRQSSLGRRGAYGAIGVVCQTLHGQDRVVRLYNYVADLLCVGEDGECGYQLFGEAIVQLLKEERAQT